jgi:hypothetical protein
MVSRPIWSHIPNGPIDILNIPIQLRSTSSKEAVCRSRTESTPAGIRRDRDFGYAGGNQLAKIVSHRHPRRPVQNGQNPAPDPVFLRFSPDEWNKLASGSVLSFELRNKIRCCTPKTFMSAEYDAEIGKLKQAEELLKLFEDDTGAPPASLETVSAWANSAHGISVIEKRGKSIERKDHIEN